MPTSPGTPTGIPTGSRRYGDDETGIIVTPSLGLPVAAVRHDPAREAVRTYAEQHPDLVAAASAAVALLASILDEAGINYLTIEGRAKSVASFAEKATRTASGRAMYADPLADIGDQLGVRVITYVRDDVEAVAALLAEQLPVLDDRDFGELTASQGRFGYASRHLQVEIEGRVVQVQLRTVLQHAWAEFEHDIRYKGTVPTEHASEFDRRFTLAAGLLELADQEFSAIRERLRGAAPTETAGDDPRIAPGELAAFLAGQYADAGWSRTDHYAWISGLLLELGITTLVELAELLRATDEAAIGARMDYRYPPGAVRRLDDALLSAFGERYVALHGNAHRRDLLEARLDRLRGARFRQPRQSSRLSHTGDMTALASPAFVPGGGAAWASPWAMYAALRDHDPVHHVVPDGRPHEDYYVLTRHEDVLRAAVDTATFSSAQGLTVEYGELEKIGLADNPPMVMLDPPEHTAFRRLVSRGLHAAGGARGRARGPCVRRREARRLRRRGRGRHRGGPVQAAAQHGGGPLPRGPGRGPRPVRRLDRRHRRRELRRAPDRGRRRDDGDARLLLRADRTPAPGAGPRPAQ